MLKLTVKSNDKNGFMGISKKELENLQKRWRLKRHTLGIIMVEEPQ
jgi:hypothetical protein